MKSILLTLALLASSASAQSVGTPAVCAPPAACATGGGGGLDGVGYDRILEDGSALTKRATVNFIGAGATCVDNAGATRTDCTISAGGTHPVALATDVSGTLPVGSGGTGAATLTDGGLLLGSGTGAVTPLGVATNGQIPIGDGTTDPVLAALTGTASEVTVTNGAGTITLSLPTGIDATKIGAGGVTSTEFGYIGGLTSDAQTQIDAKAATADILTASQVVRSDDTGAGYFKLVNDLTYGSTSGNSWGHLGSGGTFAQQAGEAKHPGIWRFTAGTAPTGTAYLSTVANNGQFIDPDEGSFVFTAILRLEALRDATDEYGVYCGVSSTVAAAPSDVIRFVYDSANTEWQIHTRASDTGTAVTTTEGPTIAATTWYNLTIRFTVAGGAVFYVNGTQVGAAQTSNIPTAPLFAQCGLVKSAGTTTRYMDIDLAEIAQIYTTSR